MKTNQLLYIGGAVASLSIALFCIASVPSAMALQTSGSVIFLSLLSSLFASIFTLFLTVLANQKLLMFKNIFENANDAIAIIGKNGRYTWQNKSHMLLSGFNDNEIKNTDAVFFVNDTKISTMAELEKIYEFSGIFKVAAKEQNKKVWVSAFKVEDELENTLCYVEMKRNINEFLKVLEQTNREKEKLEKKAKNDFLTGVYNRSGFLSKLEEKYQTLHISGCIVFADIDKFKDVNDMFGHQIGDEILISVAKLISQNLRASDRICRWGGEEFVLWIDADKETAIAICEKIRQKIEDARPIGILTTCSFGISEIDDNIEASIANADEAMYKAKQNGRNSVKLFENNNQNY